MAYSRLVGVSGVGLARLVGETVAAEERQMQLAVAPHDSSGTNEKRRVVDRAANLFEEAITA
jgi:hypothetical protein